MIEYVGKTKKEDIYRRKINGTTCIYMSIKKVGARILANFSVARNGWDTKSDEELEEYPIGVTGHVGAYLEKPADIIVNSFDKSKELYSFGEFYTTRGRLIKRTIITKEKTYKQAGKNFYEVTTGEGSSIGIDTEEKFISKDKEHKLKVPETYLRRNKYYSKIFLTMFNEVRSK